MELTNEVLLLSWVPKVIWSHSSPKIVICATHELLRFILMSLRLLPWLYIRVHFTPSPSNPPNKTCHYFSGPHPPIVYILLLLSLALRPDIRPNRLTLGSYRVPVLGTSVPHLTCPHHSTYSQHSSSSTCFTQFPFALPSNPSRLHSLTFHSIGDPCCFR